MKRQRQIFSLLFFCLLFCLTACTDSRATTTETNWTNRSPIGSMELQYAEQFAVTYYPDDYAWITIGQEEQYLLVQKINLFRGIAGFYYSDTAAGSSSLSGSFFLYGFV